MSSNPAVSSAGEKTSESANKSLYGSSTKQQCIGQLLSLMQNAGTRATGSGQAFRKDTADTLVEDIILYQDFDILKRRSRIPLNALITYV